MPISKKKFRLYIGDKADGKGFNGDYSDESTSSNMVIPSWWSTWRLPSYTARSMHYGAAGNLASAVEKRQMAYFELLY